MSAQQVEQQRFGLVVAMLGEHDPVRRGCDEGRVARAAGRTFETVRGTAFDDDMRAGEGNVEPLAQAAAEGLPAVCVHAEAVMDVQRSE